MMNSILNLQVLQQSVEFQAYVIHT